MSLELYFGYLAAALAITIVPGPTVTLIIANSLTRGSRAGLLDIAGTQLGLALMIVVVAVGLVWVMDGLAVLFNVLRIAGAIYLVYLGLKLVFRPPSFDASGEPPPPPRGGFVLQGFLVILSNPKVLLVFGAFIPQFIDPDQSPVWQVFLLGGTFMVVAAITDGAYAIVMGRARGAISRSRVRLISRISGFFLIGGGAWLALSRGR